MASIIKGQIIKHLSKFAKNLSQDRIRLSTLKGEGNLTDLELDEAALMEVLEFPSWLVLNKVVCNKVSVKIPWTKLKTHPICIYLDQVELEMATCRTLRETTDVLQDIRQSQVPVSRYGFAEKVVDGMYIHISSITGILRSDTFLINLQIAQLIVQSTTPHWKPADLRFTRIKDSNREQILTFKEVEWSTVRMTLDAIETDTERPTTPIRLITNQGKVRVTIKKRETDCGLVSSKLQMLLDDILWVLTDSQTKAVILHMRSLMPVIQKAANLSKARAADKGQPAAQTTQVQDDTSSRPHNIKTQKELQNLQYFEKYDVQETSYHIFTRSIDLHLCDEMNQPEHEKFKRRVENGAMQICLHGFSLDYYPFHTASSSREHWEFYDDCMKTSDKWIHTLLAHLKQQYKYATERMAKQTAGKGQQKVGGQSANKGNKTPPSRPRTGPNIKPKVQWQESEPARGHPEVKGRQPAAAPPSPRQQAKGAAQPPSSTKAQSSSHQARGQQPAAPPRPPPRSKVKLMSHSMVVRLRDFKFHNVAVGKGAGQHTKSSNYLLQSDKKTFFLPSDMPSLHMEYTSFYFPDELNFPVPSPVAYIQLNPVQIRLDYTSILWLNQFSCNILQTLPDVDEFSQGVVSEGKDHTDIRLDALMPKVILPAEVAVLGQPDRPPELHVQMSQVTATNSRVGTGSTRSDLSQALQSLHGKKLFLGCPTFPNAAGDAGPLPKLLWEHAYQANFVLPKECEAGGPVANGTLPNRPGPDQAGAGGPAGKLTTHVFRPDAADDVWSVKVEQVWADFHGITSSRDRPVPLVDPIPLSLWLCWPKRRLAGRQSSPNNQHNSSSSQSEAATHAPDRAAIKDGSRTDDVTDSDRLGQSPSRTVEHRPLRRVSANQIGDDETQRLQASLAQGGQSEAARSPPEFSRDPRLQEDVESRRTLDPPSLSNSVRPSQEGVPITGESHVGSGQTSEPATESCTADAHIIARTASKICVVINHYQMLFLLRLQQSIQTLQESLQVDQIMFAAKDRPVPLTSQVVTFECPDVEVTIILPPIPGDEDEEEDATGEGSTGRTSTSLSELGSASESGLPSSREADNGGSSKPGLKDEEAAAPPVLFDTESPESDNIPTVEISSSSPVKDSESFGVAEPPEARPDSGGGRNRGPIGTADGATATAPLSHSRQSSDGSGGVAAPSSSRRRKSQEVPVTSHSTSGSPIFRGLESDHHPPRSSSQSDLARVHHTQLSFSSLQQIESYAGKAESLTSLDESSVDLDIISLSSDSSEGFVMAVKGDGQSVSSGQGTETESEAGQEVGKSLGSTEEATTEVEDCRNNKFKLNKVSVVTFHLIGVDAAVEVNGLDLTVKADVKRFDREEKGNTDFKAFMSTIAAGDRSKKSKVPEKETNSNVPVALLRFQSGPKAELLSPGGGDGGFLQLEVCGLATTLRMSTVTHLGSFVIDEVIADAMPMSIQVHNSQIELMDDAPPIYPTHPGPLPMCLGLSSVHIHRTADGVFHVEGADDVAHQRRFLPPAGPEDKTPTASSPAQLEGENTQLIAQIAQMKTALGALEKERSSLLGTLEHLQEELLTSDRDRESLRSSVVELSRLLNLPR